MEKATGGKSTRPAYCRVPLEYQRYLPSAPKGMDLAIARVAIEQFQKERNIESLSLGLSPLHQMENLEFRANPITSWFLRQVLRFGDGWLDNFTGLARHKGLYHGREEKVYFASRRWFQLNELADITRLASGGPWARNKSD